MSCIRIGYDADGRPVLRDEGPARARRRGFISRAAGGGMLVAGDLVRATSTAEDERIVNRRWRNNDAARRYRERQKEGTT